MNCSGIELLRRKCQGIYAPVLFMHKNLITAIIFRLTWLFLLDIRRLSLKISAQFYRFALHISRNGVSKHYKGQYARISPQFR